MTNSPNGAMACERFGSSTSRVSYAASRALVAAGEATPAVLARALGDIERQLAEASKTTARHAR